MRICGDESELQSAYETARNEAERAYKRCVKLDCAGAAAHAGSSSSGSCAAGSGSGTGASSAGWGDLDGDGALDLYVAHYGMRQVQVVSGDYAWNQPAPAANAPNVWRISRPRRERR